LRFEIYKIKILILNHQTSTKSLLIKFGENTILMKSLEDFSICYLFKGQSYLALQKLTRFTEAIKKNSEIWKALNKSIKASEMLELDTPPDLKTVIDQIFVH
jgi:hypothetical protein